MSDNITMAKSIYTTVDHFYNSRRIYNLPVYKGESEKKIAEVVKEYFSNLIIKPEGFRKLDTLLKEKIDNEHIAYDMYPDSQYGYSFYQRKGHMMREDEKQAYQNAKKRIEQLNPEVDEALATLQNVCDLLNNSEQFTNPEFDLDNNVCEKMYKYGFTITNSACPLFERYYNQYVTLQNEKAKKTKLETEYISLNEELEKKNQELEKNGKELTKVSEQNKKNQKMLNKLLIFADKVRNSKIGSLFFKKAIKQLPERTEIEQDENNER